jgi:cytochrome c551/c552
MKGKRNHFLIVKIIQMKSTPRIVIASLTLLSLTAVLFTSCGNSDQKTDSEDSTSATSPSGQGSEVHGTEVKPGEITLNTPLNKDWVSAGKNTYELKCQSCHKLNSDRLVGPGWKDVTKRRKPEWIMNMITNVEMMLETDPEAQKLLEQCLVRMPNQNLTKDQAREVLEYMRENDGEK